MAKYDYAAAGSSCHIHQSLWSKKGKPLFLDPEGQHGMSETMRRYVAGLLTYAADVSLFLAPNINSTRDSSRELSLPPGFAGLATTEPPHSGWSAKEPMESGLRTESEAPT